MELDYLKDIIIYVNKKKNFKSFKLSSTRTYKKK